jgi:hypothetical protein
MRNFQDFVIQMRRTPAEPIWQPKALKVFTTKPHRACSNKPAKKVSIP